MALFGHVCACVCWFVWRRVEMHHGRQFVLPSGQGTILLQARIIGTSVVSNVVSYQYARAVATTSSPQLGTTAGGTLITVSGTNLGIDLSSVVFAGSGCSVRNRVLLGPDDCPVVSWSATSVTCLTRPGYGVNLPVTLEVATLFAPTLPAAAAALQPVDCVYSVVAPNQTFSYQQPVITSVYPVHGPALGGTSVTIMGMGFGGAAATPRVLLQTVLPGANRTTLLPLTVSSFNHTSIVATVPGAGGANLTLIVVHGASGATASAVAVWSYDRPLVLGVVPRGNASSVLSSVGQPCNGYNLTAVAQPWTVDSCVDVWFPATGGVVDVYGVNFGASRLFSEVGEPGVVLGGLPCYPLPGRALHVDDGHIVCASSAMVVGNVTIALAIAGQEGDVVEDMHLRAQCGPGYLGHEGTTAGTSGVSLSRCVSTSS